MLKADGSIGDGFRAGTGGPEPDCLRATPLERSCSPGGTVGECARQAQSGARASCCTRSWVLRGLGSCRRLPSPQNTEQQCSGKVTGIRARHRTSVYQTQLSRATREHRFKGRSRLSSQYKGDVQIGREFHEEHAQGTHLVWQHKVAQEREAPARERPSDPGHAALREFRLRCPEFRTLVTQGPDPDSLQSIQARSFGSSVNVYPSTPRRGAVL